MQTVGDPLQSMAGYCYWEMVVVSFKMFRLHTNQFNEKSPLHFGVNAQCKADPFSMLYRPLEFHKECRAIEPPPVANRIGVPTLAGFALLAGFGIYQLSRCRKPALNFPDKSVNNAPRERRDGRGVVAVGRFCGAHGSTSISLSEIIEIFEYSPARRR